MRRVFFVTLNLLIMTSLNQSFGQNSDKLFISETLNQKNLDNYEENKNTAISVSNAILEANWEELNALLDKDFTYTGDGFEFTKDEYIGVMQDMRSSFSDFSMLLSHAVVDGDKVSIRFISKAVNTGKFMGAPANKKNLEISGIFIRKIKDGKALQEWQTTDLLGVLNQIGFGAMFPYAIFVTGFKAKQKPPVRKPNDFLYVDGSVEKFDLMTPKQKKKYIKNYLKELKK